MWAPACWSPNGILLELGLELRKLQPLICTFSAACTGCEWIPWPGSAVLSCQLHESVAVSGKPCVDQTQHTWKADNFSYNPEQLHWITLSQAYLLLLNYPVTRLGGNGFFYRVNKWSRQHYVSKWPGCFIVFKYHFLDDFQSYLQTFPEIRDTSNW